MAFLGKNAEWKVEKLQDQRFYGAVRRWVWHWIATLWTEEKSSCYQHQKQYRTMQLRDVGSFLRNLPSIYLATKPALNKGFCTWLKVQITATSMLWEMSRVLSGIWLYLLKCYSQPLTACSSFFRDSEWQKCRRGDTVITYWCGYIWLYIGPWL